jgi:hypothetical protein
MAGSPFGDGVSATTIVAGEPALVYPTAVSQMSLLEFSESAAAKTAVRYQVDRRQAGVAATMR